MGFFEYHLRTESDRILVVLAMRRTGSHAVLHWICTQLGEVVHFNNCVVRRRGLKVGVEPMRGRYLLYQGGAMEDTGTQPLPAFRRALSGLPPLPHTLYSFEKINIRKERAITPLLEPHRRLTYVMIVRDPFNWVASSLKKGWEQNAHRKLEMWKDHIRECLDETHYLPRPFVHIDFGRWFTDEAYRRQISEQLDVPFSDDGLNRVSSIGGGSSFDGVDYNTSAQDMGVLNRWEAFMDNERYRSLVADPEVQQLSERYFGFNPMR